MKQMRKIQNDKILTIVLSFFLITLLFSHHINATVSKGTHYVFGTAHFTDGELATGAHIFIISDHGTIETFVNGSGGWKINCGDPGPNWPQQTNFTLYIDGCCSHDSWCGKETGVIEGSETDMGDILAHPNQKPVTPEIIPDHLYVRVNTPLSVSVHGYDPDEIHDVSYRLDWDANGSHDYSSFSIGVPFGETYETSHTWTSPGTYAISAIARDDHGLLSDWSNPIDVYVYESNDPPTAPQIIGPEEGMIHESYQFEITSSDDTNNIQYHIDWDDGSILNWTESYQSNEPAFFSHMWDQPGKYHITVIARDLYGSRSESSVEIIIKGPSMSITPLKNSFFSVKTTVINDGNIETEEGSYTISVEGKGVLTGTFTQGSIPALEPDESWVISSALIFGFNPDVLINITVNIPDCSPESYSTHALLLFGFLRII